VPTKSAGLTKQADMLGSKRSFFRFVSEGGTRSCASKSALFAAFPAGAMRNRNHLSDAMVLRINVRRWQLQCISLYGRQTAVHGCFWGCGATDIPPRRFARSGVHTQSSADCHKGNHGDRATMRSGFPTRCLRRQPDEQQFVDCRANLKALRKQEDAIFLQP